MELQISLTNLDHFAALFWKEAGTSKVFAFHGEMGAGKTTTIAALVRYKGVQDAVSSPTFSIINEYRYNEGGAEHRMYHIDLYRLKDEEEVIQSGAEDCLYSGAVCFVEWPQKALHLFDAHTVHVVIEPVDEQTRRVRVLSAFDAHNMSEQL
jgi:tRNA threonylcarbamoyladenosine biosynthesis protein TsaE